MKRLVLAVGFFAALVASAEIQVINGVKYECKDGMCMPIFDDDPVAAPEVEAVRADAVEPVTRMAQGYMDADRFVAFLNGEELSEGVFEGKGMWLVLLLVLLGGVAMNLTPCVLPMMPINLMVIGKSASRGLWYGAGIAVSYGVLGLLAALGGMAFGEIQGNPWYLKLWIRGNKELTDALHKCGMPPRSKSFTPKEVALIFHFLGTPRSSTS